MSGGLKQLRNRIKSVKATQKITKAMKMVAASKLRRAREAAEASRPYTTRMEDMLKALAANANESSPKMLVGNGRKDTFLLVVATSDRGLCGGFNGSIVKAAKARIAELEGAGKKVKLYCVGRKGHEALKKLYGKNIIGSLEDLSRKKISYQDAEGIAVKATELFEAGEFDVCEMVYSRFKSAISQEPKFKQLIPLAVEGDAAEDKNEQKQSYDFEPSEEAILLEILPRNLAVQIFASLLENVASEQGARMTAMDNATRNAGEMIKKLSLVYNRSRQATITKELIEIISGAEAV